MAKASDNNFPSVLFAEGTTPASPAAGSQRLFIDSADHKVKRVNSSGTVTTVEGGSGSATFSGARVYRSAALSVATGTATTVGWDAESFDSGTYHDNTTNNSRLTVPSAGKYLVSATVNTVNPWSARQMRILKNGTLWSNMADGASVSANVLTVSDVVDCAASDYIEIVIYQGTGSSQSIYTGSSSSWVTINFLGA